MSFLEFFKGKIRKMLDVLKFLRKKKTCITHDKTQANIVLNLINVVEILFIDTQWEGGPLPSGRRVITHWPRDTYAFSSGFASLI